MSRLTILGAPGMVPESSLLLTLEEISQLISHSHNPHETLENIVRLIQKRFGTDVSSVYVLEPESGELVLAATVGLDQSSVGWVRMRLDEGLTGLVAERMGPVMEPDAPLHPRFKYFPGAGEDPYHSFLGVPLIESGIVLGVLVVQTVERRPFSSNEIRMLVTVGSQLAPLVSGARMLQRVRAASEHASSFATGHESRPARRLIGSPLSSGTGLGQVYLIGQDLAPREPAEPKSVDLPVETQRLCRAMEAAREEITRLSRRISQLVGEDHGAILQAQLMILQDSTVERDLAGCLAAGCLAESALVQTLEKYVAAFQKLARPFFQERIFDIKDVFRRVMWHLLPQDTIASRSKERLVLVAHEASVLDLFSVDLDHLVGVVIEHGGLHSHAVILARSLGIPMVGQVAGVIGKVRPGQFLRVNGSTGEVELDPQPDDMLTMKSGLSPAPEVCKNGNGLIEMTDAAGTPRIEANVNLLSEAFQVLASGAQGVGLYRSEMLFLARRTLPTEEEQVETYRKLIDALKGRPVTIRTFDLRPDKLAHGSAAASSLAQTLDWRLVLESPMLKHLFKEQVRAILRAATAGPVRLLIPLVTRTKLLDFVLATVAEAIRELEREELAFDRMVPLGVMIEVAAVAPLVGIWADRVDFFSLGTNDLFSSALGIDRNDPIGILADDNLHPGLIRMIGDLITAAHRAGRPVCVCGEMASHEDGAVVLAALGADTLSLAVDRVGVVRKILGRFDGGSLAALGSRLTEARTVEEIRALLHPSHRIAVPTELPTSNAHCSGRPGEDCVAKHAC